MTGIRPDQVACAVASRLAGIPRFSSLSRQALAALTSNGEILRLACGDQILQEGEPSRSLFVVLCGRLKMARALPCGRSAFLGLLDVGDLVGVSGLGGKCDATVTAHENAVCLEVPWDDLMATLESQPRLLKSLLPILVQRVAECRHCVLETAFYRVEARLAGLFLKLLDSFDAENQPMKSEKWFLPVVLSRRDLAEMVGTSVETSIRIMSRWKKEGILETKENGFLLHDRAALEAILQN